MWGKISSEEGWGILKEGIAKLHNIVEDLEPNFTAEEHMKLYTTVYNMCPNKVDCRVNREIIREHCRKYKETCEEYIISKVLPSLREKKDELLLRELLRRWSHYKEMTRKLSYIFDFLDKEATERYALPSLEETISPSFTNLVYEAMNKEIVDAIFSVMERKLAGEKIDPTFVINTLAFYIKFYKWTEKNKEEMDIDTKIKFISSDRVEYEVDHGLAFMAKRFEETTETIYVGEVETISVSKVSSKILGLVVEFYNKLNDHSLGEVEDRCAEFVDDRDPETLLDLATCACYMKIDKLENLAWSKIGDLIKDKKPEEIAQIFAAVDH